MTAHKIHESYSRGSLKTISFIIFLLAIFLLNGASAQSGKAKINTAGKSLPEINQGLTNAGVPGSFISSVGGGINAGAKGLKIVPLFVNGHWVNVLRYVGGCQGNQDVSVRILIQIDSFINLYGAHNAIQVINRIDPGQSPSFQHSRGFTGGVSAQNKDVWVESVTLTPPVKTFHHLGLAPSPPYRKESKYDATSNNFTNTWYDVNDNVIFSHTEPEILGGGTLTNIVGVAGLFSHQPPNPNAEANPNTAGPNDGIVVSEIVIESSCLNDVVIFPDVDDIAENYSDTITTIQNNIAALLGGSCNDNKLNNAINKLNSGLNKLGLVFVDCDFDNDVKGAMNDLGIAIKSLENAGCNTTSIQEDLTDATRSALTNWIDLAIDKVGATDQRIIDAIFERTQGDSELPDYAKALTKYKNGSTELKTIFTGPCQ